MKTCERGFAFILVLILLALGSLLLTPTLSLAFSSLRGKQVNTSILMEQYTRDAAAEYAVWDLQYDGATGELDEDTPDIFYTIDLNGVIAQGTIHMRAEPGLSGQGLAHPDFKVQPWSEVTPTTATAGIPTTLNFTIRMQQVDPDPATGYIDEVWDQLPPGFRYDSGTSKFEGSPIQNPNTDIDGDTQTLHWLFDPAITFTTYGQIQEITFTASATPSDNTRYCNEVALKPNDERSGKTGFVTVGSPSYLGCAGGRVPVVVDPEPHILPPNLTTTVTFSLDFTDQDIGSHGIDEITVVLAPGFTYDSGSSGLYPSNMTTDEPTETTVNGRVELKWDTFPVKPVPFAVDETKSQKFNATVTPISSGTAYAEVFTSLADPCDYAPCTLPGDDAKPFSWQLGATIVPAYDVRAVVSRSAGWGNVIPSGSGVSMSSWNVSEPPPPTPTP